MGCASRMGGMATDMLKEHDQLALLVGVIITMITSRILYNLYCHPLAKYPGPPLWRVSRLPFAIQMMRGRYVHSIRDFHLRYGNVVRVAPDELSFADPSAWADIHHRHNTEKTFLKNPIFMAKPESHPVESIPTTTNVADHTRQRRVLEKSFGSGAIKLQEPIVQENISLLIARLREDIEKSRLTKGGQKEALVNMTDWYSFCTFDILGDLAFGEPFGCLQSGAYHKWVEIGTNNIKGLTRQTALKYYPTLYWIVERLLPKSLKEKERYHYAHTVEKVDKRMSLERKRDDFMTPVLKTKGRPEGMSKEEIYCNFGFLIIAGSETTTITLSGITNYLVQSPDVLDKLEREIRSHFSDDMEITSDTIKNLPYLDAVIKEGLRLCTAVPAGNSRIVPPGGATICGEYIPEKTSVAVHIFSVHTSSENFTDAKCFLPERWLEPRPAEFPVHNTTGFYPFGLGPKRCLGSDLAWFELRLTVAKLIFNFNFRCEPSRIVNWEGLRIFFGVEKTPIIVRLSER